MYVLTHGVIYIGISSADNKTRRDLGVSILLDTMYYQPAVGPAGILGYATLNGDGTPSQYPLEYVYTARIVDSQAPGAIIRAVPSAYLPPQFASEGPEPAMAVTDVGGFDGARRGVVAVWQSPASSRGCSSSSQFQVPLRCW